MKRVLCWFSCGAASAVAAKYTLAKYWRHDVRVIYCDTMKSEHHDNKRFFSEVERWLEHPIEVIHSGDYEDVDDVFEKTRYMSGIKGARCTVEMKKRPRFEFQHPDDIHVFGLTADEIDRISNFEQNNPELSLDWILRDKGITKEACYGAISRAGIALPAMYQIGFKNNNCLGCVKATSPVYWDRIRKYFPDAFAKRCRQSRNIGVRLVRYHGKRIFLDELPDSITDWMPEEDIECGPLCVISEQKFAVRSLITYSDH